MRVVFVHGACVRDGAWWWRRVDELLSREGVESVAAQLPSCGEDGSRPGAGGAGLREDVSALRSVLESSTEPTIVVAHSYGGIVTSEAADGLSHVERIVLISSYLPEVGESLSSFGGPEPAPFLLVDPEAGTFTVDPDQLDETFMQDCLEDAPGAAERLIGQTVSVVAEPVSASAWRTTPTTYVVCALDRGTPASAQREFARRADVVVELDAGHHPFLSVPGQVADLLLASRV